MTQAPMRNAPWWMGDPGGLAAPEAPPQPRGMFGGGGGWADKLAQFLTYFSASQGSPLGVAGMRMMADDRSARSEAEARERARLQALEDARNEWLYREHWQRSNPAPSEFERSLIAAGIDPASEEGRTLARQRAMNQANPMTAVDVQQGDGSTVRQWVRPPTNSPPPVLQTLPPGAVPIPSDGGASPTGSRTFRFR